MRIRPFLQELATYLPLSGNIEKTMDKYTELLIKHIDKSCQKYDLQKLLDYLVLTSKTKSFPTIQTIIDGLPHALIPMRSIAADSTIRITYASGRYSDFVVSQAGASTSDIIERCKRADNVVKIVLYPPGVTLIGEQICWGEIKENTEKIIYSLQG